MTNKELRKLSRKQLLELMLEQSRRIELLERQLEQANSALAQRQLVMADAGNIAEAALRLNDVFAAAQAAADQYLESVRVRAAEQDETNSLF